MRRNGDDLFGRGVEAGVADADFPAGAAAVFSGFRAGGRDFVAFRAFASRLGPACRNREPMHCGCRQT